MNDLLILGLYGAAVLGQLSDVITTQVGLKHGFVEKNKLMAWLVEHYALSAFISAGVLPIIGVLLAVKFGFNGLSWNAIIAGAGLYRGIKGYRLLKRDKVL